MKGKITFFLFMILSVLTIKPGLSQGKMDKLMSMTPEARAEIQTENMAEELNLSEDQYGQVKDLNLKYARKMQTAYDGDRRKLQRLKSMKALSQEKDKELKRILDARQYEKYRRHREEMKDKARNNHR